VAVTSRAAQSLPTISAAIIVRDEADHLRACLATLRGVVDEVVVVDTGSVDGSVQVATEYGAVVLHQDWDGRFSPPRNLGLDHCTGDWILYIDADERVLNNDRDTLRGDIQRAIRDAEVNGVVALQILFTPKLGNTPYFEWRLWRHAPDIRFEGVMHEGIMGSIMRSNVRDGTTVARTTVLHLEHHGYEGDQTAKHLRNLPLLRAELERTPERTYLWNHCGRILESLGDTAGAIEHWERAVELVRSNGVRETVDGMSWADLAMRRAWAGDDQQSFIAEGLSFFPDNCQLHFACALDSFNRGDHDDAAKQALLLVSLSTEQVVTSGLSYTNRIFQDWPHHLIGMCRFAQGRYEEAAHHFTRAATFEPTIAEYAVKARLAQARHLDARRSSPLASPSGSP
jgi:glycosyltransferase involved in cell wall biosynthesis